MPTPILRYLCPTKNFSFEVTDDVIAFDLWFGPIPIKNAGYAYAVYFILIMLHFVCNLNLLYSHGISVAL